jgi:hypothetical protein
MDLDILVFVKKKIASVCKFLAFDLQVKSESRIECFWLKFLRDTMWHCILLTAGESS